MTWAGGCWRRTRKILFPSSLWRTRATICVCTFTSPYAWAQTSNPQTPAASKSSGGGQGLTNPPREAPVGNPTNGMGGIGVSPCDLDREFAPQIAQLLATPPLQSAQVLAFFPPPSVRLACLLENPLIGQSRDIKAVTLVEYCQI
jgi:hypothetical protein